MNPALKTILLSGSWNPSRLFGSGELGGVYDPSSIGSVYQDATGVAGAVGSPVGLLQDTRYALGFGADRSVNGGFDADVNWTKQAGWTIAGGVAVCTAAAGGIGLLASPNLTGLANKWWEITYSVVSVSSGGFRSTISGTNGAIRTTTGFQRDFILAPVVASYIGVVTTAGGTSGSIDSLTVREMYGDQAVQATAGSRPTLNAGGKINFASGTKSLVTTWASALGSACTVARAIPQGTASILTGQTIGTTYTDTTDHCGLVIINRALTVAETNQLTRWLNRRGAAA